MLIGIQGPMGASKTITMVILAEFLHFKCRAPLSANLDMYDAKRIEYLDDVWELPPGIFCFDEAWLTLDSRNYAEKSNIDMSAWINQTRKKKVICFYTTQHISQIEKRMRNGTDFLLHCQKQADGHWVQFIDWHYKRLLRKFFIPNNVRQRFYGYHDTAAKLHGFYDTYEVLKPLKWKKKQKTRSEDFAPF